MKGIKRKPRPMICCNAQFPHDNGSTHIKTTKVMRLSNRSMQAVGPPTYSYLYLLYSNNHTNMIGMLELTTLLLVTTLVTLLTLPYILVVKYFILLDLKVLLYILLSILLTLLKVLYLTHNSPPNRKGKDKVQAKRWGLVRF